MKKDKVVEELRLPSQHQIGDKVNLYVMPDDPNLTEFPGLPAEVRAVHFYRGKVKYDLEVRFFGDMHTRFYNIDSVLVTKPTEYVPTRARK
jgi:hypothetical protein